MTQKLSLSEELAFNTVRIACETSSGGTSVGTGFFFQFATADGRLIPIVVTNKHVVADAAKGTFQLTRIGNDGLPKIGEFDTIAVDDFEMRWIPHPESDIDLCAMPMGPLLNEAQQMGITFYYRAFGRDDVANTQLLADLSALEEVVMIGYPVGIWDSSNNMPVFRSGVAATHPNIDYNGRSEFLIDCACYPGSSGSPVLLYNVGSYRVKSGDTIIGTRIRLLGILYAGPQFTAEGKITVVQIPTKVQPVPITQIPTNLGLVIKASKILDFEPIFAAMAKAT